MDITSSTRWLERYILERSAVPTDFSKPEYQIVMNFTMLWNIFESQYLPYSKARKLFSYKVKQLIVPERIVDETFSFFQERYIGKDRDIEHGSLNTLFTQSKDGQREMIVVQKLLEHPQDSIDKKIACFSIIYRYRNNLFHGNKDLQQIWRQSELFYRACDYLIACMNIEENRRITDE